MEMVADSLTFPLAHVSKTFLILISPKPTPINKSAKILIALLAISVTGLFAQAQSPRILFVDMVKVMNEHYKTEEQKTMLQVDAEKASAEAEKILKERNVMVEEYKELVEQDKNPMTTDAVKQQNRAAAEKKIQAIQKTNNDLQSFNTNTQNLLRQRFQNFKEIMLEEISKIAREVAQRRGVDILMDKSGPSLLGIPAVIYADASMDITAEVQAEINKSRPASSGSPQITVPMGN